MLLTTERPALRRFRAADAAARWTDDLLWGPPATEWLRPAPSGGQAV